MSLLLSNLSLLRSIKVFQPQMVRNKKQQSILSTATIMMTNTQTKMIGVKTLMMEWQEKEKIEIFLLLSVALLRNVVSLPKCLAQNTWVCVITWKAITFLAFRNFFQIKKHFHFFILCRSCIVRNQFHFEHSNIVYEFGCQIAKHFKKLYWRICWFFSIIKIVDVCSWWKGEIYLRTGQNFNKTACICFSINFNRIITITSLNEMRLVSE